ncbi:hypothetical protein [Pseudazoarcus pumilus]|nr:hypothetical protein [Pseudazoarcus pumilus]
MSVVQDLAGLSAHCDSGARARYVRDCGVWRIGVPPSEDELWTITDVDNLLTLALATAWREAGWVPFHAGLVCRDAGIAAMVCAPSGVGKTTLTLAMLRRGWKTLGDDKLLARISDDGQVEMRALTGTFNLYPHTREWFPDLSGIERFPHCSAWTDKRRVPVEWIRPAAMRDAAAPGQVLKLVRTEDTDTVRVSGLSFDETLSLLMKQTVIPGQREIARHVVRTVSMLARQVCGLEVEVGKGAYFNPRCLDALEETLESHQ